MTSVITEWDRPRRFVDEQRAGPFKSFRHEHLFSAVEDATNMIDRVEFAAPFGPIGWVAERLVLDRYLRRLINVRNELLIAEATRIGATTSPEPTDE
jgi:ligand-binding SRPBCC domain-containing protein